MVRYSLQLSSVIIVWVGEKLFIERITTKLWCPYSSVAQALEMPNSVSEVGNMVQRATACRDGFGRFQNPERGKAHGTSRWVGSDHERSSRWSDKGEKNIRWEAPILEQGLWTGQPREFQYRKAVGIWINNWAKILLVCGPCRSCTPCSV